MDLSRYKDPEAAAATLAKIADVERKLAAIGLSPQQLGQLAALTAHTYISAAPDDVRAYAETLAVTDPKELTEVSLEALAWSTLYGPRGSDASKAASATLAWA